MTDYRSIDIDLSVHRKIEGERQSFAETDNDVLKRLLGIGRDSKPHVVQPQGRSWAWKGVELPHGTQLRMTYNGRTHAGEISNGRWIVAGTAYPSPSSAASALALTKAGSRTSLNGWDLWEAKLPGAANWAGLQQLRGR